MKPRTTAFVLSVVGALVGTACKNHPAAVDAAIDAPIDASTDAPIDSPGCVPKCSTALTEGGPVCAGTVSATRYSNLISCAQGFCATECMDLIMSNHAVGPTCGSCLQVHCGFEYTDCSNDF